MFVSLSKTLTKFGGFRLGLGLRITKKNICYIGIFLFFYYMFLFAWYFLIIVFWLIGIMLYYVFKFYVWLFKTGFKTCSYILHNAPEWIKTKIEEYKNKGNQA